MQPLKLVFLLSLALLLPSGRSDANTISQLCKTTSNIQLCESTLQSDPRSTTADTKGLILLLVDSSKSKFTSALGAVQELRKKSAPPALAKALADCEETFRFVLKSDIPVTEEAVSKVDPKFGEEAMNDAADTSQSCQEAVAGSGGEAAFVGQAKGLYDISHVTATAIRFLE